MNATPTQPASEISDANQLELLFHSVLTHLAANYVSKILNGSCEPTLSRSFASRSAAFTLA